MGGGHDWDRSLECRRGGQGRTDTWEAPARGWDLQPWGERAYGGKQAGAPTERYITLTGDEKTG